MVMENKDIECDSSSRPLECLDCAHRKEIYANLNIGYIICDKLGKVYYNNIIKYLEKEY